MDTGNTLLAHLSSKFTGRTEDIAVETLGHILSSSEAARNGLHDVLRNGGAESQRHRPCRHAVHRRGRRASGPRLPHRRRRKGIDRGEVLGPTYQYRSQVYLTSIRNRLVLCIIL